MQEQDDTATSCMELASHMTRPKEPSLDRERERERELTAAKIAALNPSGKK